MKKINVQCQECSRHYLIPQDSWQRYKEDHFSNTDHSEPGYICNACNGWGGTREGAGRKPPLGSPTIKKSIQLTPAEWANLAKIHATPSQAIRTLLDQEQP